MYDDDGNIVSAEPVRTRKLETTEHVRSSRALRAPVDFASLERVHLDASNAKDGTIECVSLQIPGNDVDVMLISDADADGRFLLRVVPRLE